MRRGIVTVFCLFVVALFAGAQEQEEVEATDSGELQAVVGAADASTDMTGVEALAERLQPFGKLCLEGDDCGGIQAVATAPSGGLTGLEVYNRHCFACHAAGLLEAPLVGSEAWQERLAKGMEVLLESTRNGIDTTMPPMGTCMTCTDDELIAAIQYMITGEESS